MQNGDENQNSLSVPDLVAFGCKYFVSGEFGIGDGQFTILLFFPRSFLYSLTAVRRFIFAAPSNQQIVFQSTLRSGLSIKELCFFFFGIPNFIPMASTVNAFASHQARSSVLVERERALDARRAALMELRQAVGQLAAENSIREEQLAAERSRFQERKRTQDAKLCAKDAEARGQQARVAELEAEEERLSNAIARREEEAATASAEVDRRRDLEATLREARETFNRTKFRLEEQDAKVMRLETRLARQELVTDKRHALLAEREPQYWLPRMAEVEKSATLEETAGESVYLVDELTG